MSIHLCRVKLNERRKQIIDMGSNAFPIQAYDNDFEQMAGKEVPWHWHKDLEVIYIAKGNLILYIQDEMIPLHQEESVFINANVLHAVKKHSQNCIAYSFVFSTKLISNNEHDLYENQYVTPLVTSTNIPYIKFTNTIPWHKEASVCILQAFKQYEEGSYGYEFLVKEQFLHLWYLMVYHFQNKIQDTPKETMDASRIKLMLDYIHTQFQDTITLQQIAQSANISNREAIRCFQKMLKDTPISYVMKYRIHQAIHYLVDTDLSITEISSLCGFENPSYFTKIFKRIMKVTPKSYRS